MDCELVSSRLVVLAVSCLLPDSFLVAPDRLSSDSEHNRIPIRYRYLVRQAPLRYDRISVLTLRQRCISNSALLVR